MRRASHLNVKRKTHPRRYMATFKLRFRFNISHKGMITGDDKEYEFALPNGHPAKLHCIDAEKFGESTRFALTSGSYQSEEEALDYAQQIKESTLCFGAKHRMGIDAGKDKASGGFTSFMKEKILSENGLRVIDDVHGVTAYSEDIPTSCVTVSATELLRPRGREFFADEICTILSEPRCVNSKTKLSMELLTASFFETSPRSRFLTLVLAAESVLDPNNRSESASSLVDHLRGITKCADIPDDERLSILGSLNWLKKDSISQSLRKMAAEHLPDHKYDGLPSESFIKKCYEARSYLVHTGEADERKYNIGGLAANLEVYMRDMLVKLSLGKGETNGVRLL